jgi:hypothetical protein
MNNQLKASKSHFVSKRDENFSLLDILLNRVCASENVSNIQSQINDCVREIAICSQSIMIIDGLVQNAESSQTE